MSKVFGIGWAKTGTTTLGTCFEILGYTHQSQDLSLVPDLAADRLARIIEVARAKTTFEDWPWLLLYKELDEAFPGSLFILTRRDTAAWLRSYRNMLTQQGEATEEDNRIRRILYRLPFPQVSAEQLIDRYERHNAEVTAYFRNRPQDLLVVNWEQGDGWPELCGFLGKPIPSVPFPHANRGHYRTE